MKCYVEMTEEEYGDFLQWKADRAKYDRALSSMQKKFEMMANKATWAIEPDPKKEDRCKIVDHDHAMELLEMAWDILDEKEAKSGGD